MMSSPSRQYISKLCNLTAFQDQNVITFEANETKPTKFYLGKVVDVLLFMVCIALRYFFIFLTISIVSIHNRFGHATGSVSELPRYQYHYQASVPPVGAGGNSLWEPLATPKFTETSYDFGIRKIKLFEYFMGGYSNGKICYSSQRYSSLTCPLHRTWLQMEGGGGVIQHL